jgi:hypothetical protein
MVITGKYRIRKDKFIVFSMTFEIGVFENHIGFPENIESVYY